MNGNAWQKSYNKTKKVTDAHSTQRKEFFENHSKKHIAADQGIRQRETEPLPRIEKCYHGEQYFSIAGVKCWID